MATEQAQTKISFSPRPYQGWWHKLSKKTLRHDLYAGLTGAIVVLPQSVALALLAGLPVEYGLYTAIVPVIIAALLGSSFHLMSGPTTAISIVVFATIAPLAEPGSSTYISLALTLTLAAGLFQLALGLARMGALVNFISHTVIVGFTAGAAILVITSQLQHMVGIWLPRDQSFLNTWSQLIEKLPLWDLTALSITVITIITALLANRFIPRWPGLLLAMVTASLFAQTMGGDASGIKFVGALPSSLPPISSPDFSLETWQQITSGALAIAILGLMESVSIARSISHKSHQLHNANQEFIGQGVSNIVGSFFSSYASSGSFTRSALNYSVGAKTPMAAIFSAIGVAIILLTAASLAAYLPIACMAGILLLVAYKLFDLRAIKTILITSRADAAVLATTFFATVFIELTFAIYVGVMLSLILHLIRISHPNIVSRTPDPEHRNRRFTSNGLSNQNCPQLKIIRIDGSVFFGSVSDIEAALHHIGNHSSTQNRVLIICSGINNIDVSGAELLKREASRRRSFGGALYLCSVKPDVRRLLQKGGFLDSIGKKNIFRSKASAIRKIYKQLDDERCKQCSARIFRECPATGDKHSD